jgi:hypothetical protein
VVPRIGCTIDVIIRPERIETLIEAVEHRPLMDPLKPSRSLISITGSLQHLAGVFLKCLQYFLTNYTVYYEKLFILPRTAGMGGPLQFFEPIELVEAVGQIDQFEELVTVKFYVMRGGYISKI